MQIQKIMMVAAGLMLAEAAVAMPSTLNDPTRATKERDVAAFDRSKILYEAKQDEHWWVAYHLSRNGDFDCYRLTLMIQNKGETAKVVTPDVSVLDSKGATITTANVQGVLSMASAMAGAPIPSAPPSVYQSYSGTARSWSTGETYSVTVQQNNGGFWGGLAAGIAQGQRNAAIQRAMAGLDMLKWVNAFWLRTPMKFEPQGYGYGSLLLDGPNDRPLPIRVRVKIEDSEFEFTTRAK